MDARLTRQAAGAGTMPAGIAQLLGRGSRSCRHTRRRFRAAPAPMTGSVSLERVGVAAERDDHLDARAAAARARSRRIAPARDSPGASRTVRVDVAVELQRATVEARESSRRASPARLGAVGDDGAEGRRDRRATGTAGTPGASSAASSRGSRARRRRSATPDRRDGHDAVRRQRIGQRHGRRRAAVRRRSRPIRARRRAVGSRCESQPARLRPDFPPRP